MADGPAAPNPPVEPPQCVDPDCEDCDAHDWSYWGDEFRQPWELLAQNRFPADGPAPDVKHCEDFPDHRQYRQS